MGPPNDFAGHCCSLVQLDQMFLCQLWRWHGLSFKAFMYSVHFESCFQIKRPEGDTQPTSHPWSAHTKWQRCLLSREELKRVQNKQRKAWRERGRNNLWRYLSKHEHVCYICWCVFWNKLCFNPVFLFFARLFFLLFCLFVFSSMNSEERRHHCGGRWVTSSHPEGLSGSSGDSPGVD